MKHLKLILPLVAITMLTMVFILTTGKNKTVLQKQIIQQSTELFFSDEMTKASSFSFAGETVPLNKWYVKERLDREILVNSYWHSNTIMIIKRTAKYFPIIEPILKEHNIPADFKYLCVIESSLTNAVSPAGAVGFWQFMKGTGREYGLEVNKYIDERRNIEKSTHAACKYLNKMYKKFNNWTLVAASYNVGYTGLKKRMNKQKANDYYNLKLPEETQRYMYRILAFKKIICNPAEFNFKVNDKYYFPEYKEQIVDKSINNLVNFAQKNSTTYHDLTALNPWLLKYKLPNRSGKKYVLKIPVYDKN